MRDEYDDESGGVRRYVRIAVPAFVFALIAGGIWYLLHDPSATRREAPPLPTLQAFLPPPPPPPPKPKEKPPEPEKKVEEVRKAAPTPKQVDAPKPLTMSGPAQAGNDAYGIGQGEGGGDVAGGSGVGSESYGRYLTSVVQNAVQQDERVNRLAFSVQVIAWVDASRRLHLRLVQSSGDPKVDGALVTLADGLPAVDEEPPGSGEFRLAIRSRRPT
ncbi:MAG: ferric siderophore transporter TonB [Alphaproteobacteria bacterium]|nr:ferric siderophore transporter TonB [Alphaproteobacteria bacterium]